MPFDPPISLVVNMKGRELLDYAKDKYKQELSWESVNSGSDIMMHYLTLNGVEIGLAVGKYSLGVHTSMPDLLYEAKGACAPVLGERARRFLVFGAHDLAGRLVDPFLVRVYKDGNTQLIVGEERVQQVEALFRMFLVLAMGW